MHCLSLCGLLYVHGVCDMTCIAVQAILKKVYHELQSMQSLLHNTEQ